MNGLLGTAGAEPEIIYTMERGPTPFPPVAHANIRIVPPTFPPLAGATVPPQFRAMLRRTLLLLLALWLGMGVGVSFVAIPHVFSPAVRDSLPPGGAGRIAQGILLRMFQCQVGLAGAACAMHFAGRANGSVPASRFRNVALPALLAIAMAALFWVYPTMTSYFETKYRAGVAESARLEAGRRFGAWHGASQAGNLLILATVLACSWQLSHGPPRVPRSERARTNGKGDGEVR